MAIQEEFGDFPSGLAALQPDRRNPNLDPHAVGWLTALKDNIHRSGDVAYGKGSWGFTVLRTVYTEESDALFPVAIKALEQWITNYYVHLHRFPWFGTQGERCQKTDGSANEEISRRFRIEVLEDKDTMNFPTLAGASHETIQALVDRFNQWVVDVGEDPMAEYPSNPRLAGCLAVDLVSLDSLVKLSQEPIPPLRAAVDLEEKQQWRDRAFAYLWAIDARAVGRFVAGVTEHWERGWAKLHAEDIPDAWFFKASHWDWQSSWLISDHTVDECGDFWFMMT
ncbi:hypothetical protein ACCO45_010038 [Purpureocillium lilacinum]|uniref:Uncharacterized protein n=1 Tax=Purpureocillium lilacinum TaxID=33203 RepID=A0ACC4DDP0_PURLI